MGPDGPAATPARRLPLVTEVDRREAWVHDGVPSGAHWVAWRTGLELGAAREHLRVARALTGLPGLAEAFGRGEVSCSRTRAVTRMARLETDADPRGMARAGSTAQVERLVRAYRRADPTAACVLAAAQVAGRRLHTWCGDAAVLADPAADGRAAPGAGATRRPPPSARGCFQRAARLHADWLAPIMIECVATAGAVGG